MGLSPWISYSLVALTSILVFANSLYGAFCFDDAFALLYNGDVHHRENSLKNIFFHDFWGHDITKPDSHKSYRPFTTISFRMNYLTFLYFGGNETRPDHIPEDMNGSTWQPEPFLIGLHLVNVLLHAAVSCYVYKLAKEIWSYMLPAEERESSTKEPVNSFWSEMIPLLGGLAFATHPAHVEAVASIVGRAELLSALLALIGFDLWRHRKSWSSTVLAILVVYASVLCKEITFAMYGVFIVWDGLKHLRSSVDHVNTLNHPTPTTKSPNNAGSVGATVNPKHSVATGSSKSQSSSAGVKSASIWLPGQKQLDKLRCVVIQKLPFWAPGWVPHFLERTFFSTFWLGRTIMTLIAFVLYLRMRVVLMGDSMVVQNYRRVENPLAYIENKLHLMLSMAFLHTNYLWILVYPVYLSCDWSFNCIPLISSIYDMHNLYSAVAYASIAIPSLWSIVQIFRGSRMAMPLLFCIFWGILFFTPASNLFFFVGTMLAERVLYLPSVTFCILLPIALERLFSFLPRERRLQLVTCICVVLIAAYSQRTWTRNVDWTDNQHLFESAEEVCPDSAKVHFNLGILRTQQRIWHRAAHHFKRVLEIEPNYCEVNYRRALMYLGQNQYPLGLADLHAALDCIYTRADSANALFKVYQALVQADPPNAEKYANAWNSIVKRLEPVIQAEKEGKRPVRQG
jgi:hypothetical protein